MKTLKNGSAEYVQHLIENGQKPSTVGTAKRTLDLLIDFYGPDISTALAPDEVESFLTHDPVMQMPNGKPRAEASRLQIQRIIRAAVTYWNGEGYLGEKQHKPRVIKPKAAKAPKAEAKSEPAEGEEPAMFDEPASEPDAQGEAQPCSDLAETLPQEPVSLAATLHEPCSMEPDPTPEPVAPAARVFVPCHKTHQRRDANICQTKGCINSVAQAKCKYWKEWEAAGLV